MNRRGRNPPLWLGIATVLVFTTAGAITYAWSDEDWREGWFRSFVQLDHRAATQNPGALAAVTLLFGCSGALSNQCWDVAASEMRDYTTTSMRQPAR